MAMVWATALDVESYLAAEKDLEVPRPACPGCATAMCFWCRRRDLRVGKTDHQLWVRRLRCAGCACSHAVLPEFVTWGHLDEVGFIGAGILALVAGLSGPRVAARLKLPYTTVRDWGRRFASRAELIGAGFLAVVVALGALPPRLPRRPTEVALVAIEAAWAAAQRRLTGGVGAPWRLANAVIGSHLISTNIDPPWAIA